MGIVHVTEYCDDCDVGITTVFIEHGALRRTCYCRAPRFIETPESRDALTKLVTGQPSFATFVKNGLKEVAPYQPTFCGQSAHHRQEKGRLADAFDKAMALSGSMNRAHRCHWHPPKLNEYELRLKARFG